MRCPGSGGWHVGAAPLRDRDRLPRGYCPECGRSHALTTDGRIWQHQTPSATLTESARWAATPTGEPTERH